MTVSSPPAAETAAPPMIWVATAKLAGSLLLAAAAVLVGSRGVPLGSLAAGILAGLAVGTASPVRPGLRWNWGAQVAVAVLACVLAWSVNATMRVWQGAPARDEGPALFPPRGGGGGWAFSGVPPSFFAPPPPRAPLPRDPPPLS